MRLPSSGRPSSGQPSSNLRAVSSPSGSPPSPRSPLLTSAVTIAGAAIHNSPALRDAVTLVLAGNALPEQRVRIATAAEIDSMRAAIAAHGDAFARDLQGKGRRRGLADAQGDAVDDALAMLKAASTYVARTRFDDAAAMAPARERIAQAVARRAPLVLALPLGGGKVANSAKTGAAFLPDAGEWIAWTRLGGLARALGERLGVPVRVLVLPDAPLHTADLRMPAVESALHLAAARGDLEALGLGDVVHIADTNALLSASWPDAVHRHAVAARNRHAADPAFAVDVAAQAQSLLFAENLRALALPFERELLLTATLLDMSMGPKLAFPADVVAHAARLRADVDERVFHYIGTNHALRSLAVPERAVAQQFGDAIMLRATVHAKPGEPQPQLVPSGERARPGLLPMHGVGVRYVGSRGDVRVATQFALEARMGGQCEVRDGEGRVVWFEAGPAACAGSVGNAA